MNSFYIDKETKKQLEYLCKLTNLSEKQMIKEIISNTYRTCFKLSEKPEDLLPDVISAMLSFTKALKTQSTNKGE